MTLKIKVQVDRLPDIDSGGSVKCQLGLRVSAIIAPDGAMPTAVGDATLILPWLWRAAGGAADGSWDPHSTASWILWQLDPGVAPVELARNAFTMAVAARPGFDTPGPNGSAGGSFRGRIDSDVADIVASSGVAALQEPVQGGVVKGRTVFGLAESLTALPSPVPACMKVWTAVTLDRDLLVIGNDTRFIAVPTFRTVNGADYAPAVGALPAGPGGDGAFTLAYPSVAPLREATASVFPSLPMTTMEIKPSDQQRLIDLSTLLVRPGAAGFEGKDWNSSLALRLAEALDPSARVMAVLDEVIRASARAAPQAIAHALGADLLPAGANKAPDRLRRVLATLHAQVVAARARSARPTSAPAVSFLERLALADPGLWPAVAPLLLAHAGAEDQLQLPAVPKHAIVSRARLADLAGVVVSRRDLLDDDAALPAIDSEQAFRNWLVRHWTSMPPAALSRANGSYMFAGSMTRMAIENGKAVALVEPTGAIDLLQLPGGSTVRLPVGLAANAAGAPASTDFRLDVARLVDASTPLFTLVLAPLALRLGGVDYPLLGAPLPGSPNPRPLQLDTFVLTLEIVAGTGPGRTIELGFVASDRDGTASVARRIDITELARRGRLALTVTPAGGVPGAALVAGIRADSALLERMREAEGPSGQGLAMRSALALAYAGPALAGLMAGWVPIDQRLVTSADTANGGAELSERIASAVGLYVDHAGGFQQAFDRAGAAALAEEIDARQAAILTELATYQFEPATMVRLTQEQAGLAAFKTLLEALWAAAKADAKRLATLLVPPPAQRDAERITPDALPLSFTIDQLQDFDDTVDLWTRLAGLGVLIGRENSGTTEWWSLNAASLHVSHVAANHLRSPLDASNAVTVDPARPSWWKAAQVDPVPLVVTEVQGVRNVVIRYENQSIVAEMQRRPRMDAPAQAKAAARRPEAYLFPVGEHFPKLPTLTFGRTYKIVPYLIGHGGVVPAALRAAPLDPCSAFDETLRDRYNGKVALVDAAVQDAVRTKPYLRTVAVGAPRLLSALPSGYPGVAALAAELPFIPPPITLRDNKRASFFLDADNCEGTLRCPDAGADAEPALRIEVADLALKCGAHLNVVARRSDVGGAAVLVDVAVDFDQVRAALATAGCAAASVAIRIDIVGDQARTFALALPADAWAEDDPQRVPVGVATAATSNVADWKAFALELTTHGASVDAVPPSIRWGTPDPYAPGELALHGAKAFFPPELVKDNGQPTILDGIGKQRERVGPYLADIRLERPSTPLATYDRWVNGALSGYGDGDPCAVHAALGRAAQLATNNAAGDRDRTLDDPAVEAIIYEVVQRFPTRTVIRAAQRLGKRLRTLDELLGNAGAPSEAAASLRVLVDDGQTTIAADQLGVKPGHIYELRFYGALAASQKVFANGVPTMARFSPAVAAGWRDAVIDGQLMQLGSPLVMTIEVAAVFMPQLYRAHPPFYLTLRRPPYALRDQVVLRLAPDLMTTTPGAAHERYQAVRMADRIALLERRWSWRGRPHPELGRVEDAEFGAYLSIGGQARDFVDAAFLGRSDADLGHIREVSIGRGHAYLGRPRFPAQADGAWVPDRLHDGPEVLSSDLGYEGGANLWQYAIRAKSRYAAMRPDDPRMLSFSHARSAREPILWWPLIVPDRTSPLHAARRPKRPGLMLVVPLTEALADDGCVPPLLALFNEPMFPLYHAGDGIEAVVEVARHPFAGYERIPDDAGELAQLRAEWGKVEMARQTVDAAAADLASLMELAASPAAGAIAAAKRTLGELETKYADAASVYRKYAGEAGARGYGTQLKLVHASVLDELASIATRLQQATSPAVIAYLTFEQERYTKRRDALADEIVAAKKLTDYGGADAGPVGNPMAKYWPELAPDPIRTGQGASGKPMAIRCDGPVGYTFDLETEAGRFDHAGLLLSPVAGTVRPWSMVKMRFRRLEAPELLVNLEGRPLQEALTLGATPEESVQLPLSSTYPLLQATAPAVGFHTSHEGLALDVHCGAGAPLDAALQIGFDDPLAALARHVTVKAHIERPANAAALLVIRAGTELGMSAPWSAPIGDGASVEVRLVVSQQATPKAEKPPGAGQRPVPPRGDVSVRVRITPPLQGSGDSGHGATHEHAWLSVICMPLTGTPPASSLPTGTAPPWIYLHGAGTTPHVVVRPIRLSEFTSPVWCQFAAGMSRVTVSAIVAKGTAMREIRQVLPVTELTARAQDGGKKMVLGLRQVSGAESLTAIGLSAEGKPDADAQIEECLYAIVTRYVCDAFDHLRERPLSVHRLPDDAAQGWLTLGAAVWPAPAPVGAAPFKEGSGRIRIVRVLRGKTRDAGGFETAPQEFPNDFFGAGIEAGERMSDNPLDAAGLVLGISQPFEWRQG